METTIDNSEISGEKLKKDTKFKSGEEWNGNANGRPPGSFSLKTLIIKRLQEDPEAKQHIIDDLLAKDQGLILQMIDGKPKQSLDVKGDINMSTDPEKRALIENAIDSITTE